MNLQGERPARRTKVRRVVAASLAVVLVTLVAFLPNWSRQTPPQPTQLRSFLTLRAASALRDIATAVIIVRSRSVAFGLKDVRVTAVDDRTLLVNVEGSPPEALLRAIALPYQLHFRKVLDIVRDVRGSTPGLGTASTVDQVAAKLGSAYTLAQSITDPRNLDIGTRGRLARFGDLSVAEVGLLPAEIQFMVPAITCAHLPPRLSAMSAKRVTTCHAGQKYLLDAAALTGDSVTSVAATEFPVAGPEFGVVIGFSASGQSLVNALSNDSRNSSEVSRCTPPARGYLGWCFVVLVLNGVPVVVTQAPPNAVGLWQVTPNLARFDAVHIARALDGKGSPPEFQVISLQVREAPIATPTSGP